MDLESIMPDIPSGYFPMERVCCHCQSFDFIPREGPGQAYCHLFKKHFPDQFDPDHLPAGSRACRHWEQRTIFGYGRERG